MTLPAHLFDDPSPFAPTPAAARARLQRVDPSAYARSRNALDGAVSGLSPYITHGFVSLPEVRAGLRQRVAPDHKFIFELAWREYFHHVWAHAGDGIFESIHPGPLPEAAYARELPVDIREARTGVPVIDASVRRLYRSGWLHNHARMWLAAYVVHYRRVHWRAGADWLYGHLLDGDLASNHLSWQWVAGTGSAKPYLFNADNVAKFAGREFPDVASPGTGIDAPYAVLERIARGGTPLSPEPGADALAGTAEPPLLHVPPADLLARLQALPVADPAALAGQRIWIAHPWSLADPPAGHRALLLWQPDFHRRWPWSERRWRFAFERLLQIAAQAWPGAVPPAAELSGFADPHLQPAGLPPLQPPPRLLRTPTSRCSSFSVFWRQVGPAPGRSG